MHISKHFIAELERETQALNLCGVSVHHQNSITERATSTISESARCMMLHTMIH